MGVGGGGALLEDFEHDTILIAANVIPAIIKRENLLFTFFILFDFYFKMNKDLEYIFLTICKINTHYFE
jgi:hypothetical protein